MSKRLIYILLAVVVVFQGVVFSRDQPITKVGEWGTSQYLDVFIQGTIAYCAADSAGLDIIDISNPANPQRIGNYDTSGYAYGVHVSGNYAYVADYDHLEVIDISMPSSPTLVSTYDTRDASEVFISGNYAYVAASDRGLLVIDISTPASPVLVGDYDTPDYAKDVYVNGNYAYVADGYSGLQVIDITTPSAPVLMGNYDTPDFASGVYISGNYAYVADGYGALEVIDISTPSAPALVGNYDTSSFASGVHINGNYAYVSNGSNGLLVIDISTSSSPVLVGDYNTPDFARDVYVSGNYAYLADAGSGLQVIDISTPSNPSRAGYYDHSVFLHGVYASGNYAYVVDSSQGLQVLDISNPSTPFLTGTWNAVDPDRNYMEDVYIKDNYAYVADGYNGLQVIDISTPASPTRLGVYDTPGFTSSVHIRDNYAYLADKSSGLQVIDISTPTAPVLAGNYDGFGMVERLHVNGNYAYLAKANAGLSIIDISTPSAPTLVGTWNPEEPSQEEVLVKDVYVKGDYAYLAAHNWGLYVIDISTPSAPIAVTYYETAGYASNLYISGNYAYVAEGESGLQVIDISTPSAPVLAGSYDTSGYTEGLYVRGPYVYIAEASGKFLILEMPTYTLNVQSSPGTGAAITVTPNDENNNGDGNTNFIRTYASGTGVTLTAPATLGERDFLKWLVNGTEDSSRTIHLTMNSDYTAEAIYAFPSAIALNRTGLHFCYILGGNTPPSQTFMISNSGEGTLNWTINNSTPFQCSPSSGIDGAVVTVTADPTGLSAGSYSDLLEITAPGASNSPQQVPVYLEVKNVSADQPPFGEFSTPIDGSTVSSSVPVTGWVLDDTGVESVKIYREENGNLIFIGDGVFVEGARPDIEAAFPVYPASYKAGWGYMMLSNFLPNGGNGTFTLHAVATDTEGNQAALGTAAITCDNLNAVKPFGAIDTPAQGGTASGSVFRNQGWVLTPMPNRIPEDGSTIDVYIDGVKLGQAAYNIYRPDIAELFPGYANSNGAMAYFDFDSTAYTNGVHTIAWITADDAGNSDGIGSRYFSIQNSVGNGQSSMINPQWSIGNGRGGQSTVEIPVDYSNPVGVIKGYGKEMEPQEMFPNDDGMIILRINELERLELHLTPHTKHLTIKNGYQLVGNQAGPLPVGSHLDSERGVFYWLPGPGQIGEHQLIFAAKGAREVVSLKRLIITILPKFAK